MFKKLKVLKIHFVLHIQWLNWIDKELRLHGKTSTYCIFNVFRFFYLNIL